MNIVKQISTMCTMNYTETLEYLFTSLPQYSRIGTAAYKDGLENTLALDKHFGYPHRKFKTIHIAGTNGKGSTSHLLAAALQQAGYKTGLYTSPHLKDFRERIRINGEMIDENFVVDFVAENRTFFDELSPSFFEMSVLMAFDYFAEKEVDVAVIEVGLGGRLDSTNIIMPELSVITNISLDHTNLLGNTLEKIAAEKAGIIKPNIPVVIGESSGVKRVFEEKARQENAPIYFAEECYSILDCFVPRNDAENNTNNVIASDSEAIQRYKYELKKTKKNWSEKGEINLGLLGDYQQKNLATALTAVQVLNENNFHISEDAVRFGFEKVVELTGLLGRWQVLQKNPTIICDVGHNEVGISCIVEQLKTIQYNKLHFVLGMVSDKDVDKVLSLLPSENTVYYFTKASIPRALNEIELQQKALKHNLHGDAYPTVKAAFEAAKKSAEKDDAVFVGGSNFVVAEVL